MEYLAGLYTLLLVVICLELAVVLWRTGKKQGGAPDHDELKRWMQQQLDAQAKEFAARQSALAEQNHTALRSVSETLQTAVQNMSTTLAQGQDSQQQLLEHRLRSLEASNTQKLEELRRKPGMRLDASQHYLGELTGAAAPFRYEGCVRRGILNAKYQGKPWRAVEMGNRLVQLAFGGELTVQYGELLPQPVPWAAIGYDLIVPVPASGKKRGYNVPELMALPLAKAMEVPLAPQALERIRAKRHQAGLPLEQRMANVAGAFRAAQPQQLEGKRILLVDDVITTGTTAAACAQALLHAGADSVFALAFATVEFGAPPDDTTPICEDDEEDVYSDF